jgi:hypothetical protein
MCRHVTQNSSNDSMEDLDDSSDRNED